MRVKGNCVHYITNHCDGIGCGNCQHFETYEDWDACDDMVMTMRDLS